MAGKVCLFNKCHGPPKWKRYGITAKEAVAYSKLLGQKKGFQEFNDMQISKSGKMNSYCIIDKKYSPSNGSNINIFICDEEEYHGAVYLEYSVHKQYVTENCNDLITFLNLNKNSTFRLHDSFIYVKSVNRFKWVLFFGVLEFLIKNLNMSIIGSQFYFPLFSKYLIMNELRLMFTLHNWLKNLSVNFMKTFNWTCEASKLSLKKGLQSRASHLASRLQNPKNKTSLPSEQAIRKMKNLNSDSSKSIQKLQLKRKSVDSFTGDDYLPKTKRFNSEKNVCHCKNYTWKVFIPFKKTTLLNYTSILEAKKSVDGLEAMHVFPADLGFQSDCLLTSDSSILHPNQNVMKQDFFSALNTSEKTLSVQLLDKVNELKNITDLPLEKTKEKQPKSEKNSDLQTIKEMDSTSDDRKNSSLDDFDNFHLSALECGEEESKNEQIHSRATITNDPKNSGGPSGGNLAKPDFIGVGKHSVTFQTASGKSLKISETALQAAEKMFEDISSESLDIFPEKKTQNALHLKSVVNDRHCVGFQTASGKSLHASKAALEAAEKMFKEIKVEEVDVFPEKQAQTKQSVEECYPNLKDCVDDDISKVLAENFFEDIPFDDKDTDSKPIDSSMALTVQKPENTKTHKIRKSLGGRRSLKPYGLKK